MIALPPPPPPSHTLPLTYPAWQKPSWQQWIGAIVLMALLGLTWYKPMDQHATEQLNTALTRAGTSFLVARGIQAVLNVVQEAQVSIQVGAGVTLKPGAVLRPLSDLVERFADVLFLATASLALQRLMVGLSGQWGLCVLVTVLVIPWVLGDLLRRPMPLWWRKWAMVMLVVRLATPLFALGSQMIHHAVLLSEYETNAQALALLKAPTLQAPAPTSWWDKLRGLANQGMDLAGQVEQLRTHAERLVDHMIRQVAVFLFEVLIMPLMYGWLLLWGLRQWRLS